jgi:hypothetical protein
MSVASRPAGNKHAAGSLVTTSACRRANRGTASGQGMSRCGSLGMEYGTHAHGLPSKLLLGEQALIPNCKQLPPTNNPLEVSVYIRRRTGRLCLACFGGVGTD